MFKRLASEGTTCYVTWWFSLGFQKNSQSFYLQIENVGGKVHVNLLIRAETLLRRTYWDVRLHCLKYEVVRVRANERSHEKNSCTRHWIMEETCWQRLCDGMHKDTFEVRILAPWRWTDALPVLSSSHFRWSQHYSRPYPSFFYFLELMCDCASL